MKTNLIILLVCIMPVVLFGNSLMQHQYFAHQAPSVLIHENNPVLSQMRGVSQLPIKNVNRDRNWRLLECNYAQDMSGDGQLTVINKDMIFYNEIYPACIDSIVGYNYEFETETFLPGLRRIFFYDTAGEKVIRTEWLNQTNGNEAFMKYTYEYDASDRLINENHYQRNEAGSSLVRTIRADYVYDNDGLIGINQLNTDTNGAAITWFRQTYGHDTQGRIINRVVEMSSDSLYWGFFVNVDKSYHPNDMSIGADYIRYLSYVYPVSISEAYGYEDLIGMPSETITSWWGTDMWAYVGRFVYAYGNTNRLETVTGHSYNTGWSPTYRTNYAFDDNDNVQMYSSQSYDTVNNDWDSIDEANTLTWEEYTGVDDEVAPAVALNLSAYPNPFQNEVSFRLNSKDNAPSEARIYNLKGQLVRQFGMQKGKTFAWDGKDTELKAVSNGIYLIKITQNKKTSVTKIIKVK
jgi:hypothetical protein